MSEDRGVVTVTRLGMLDLSKQNGEGSLEIDVHSELDVKPALIEQQNEKQINTSWQPSDQH